MHRRTHSLMAEATEKTVLLTSNEGESYAVARQAATQSALIATMLDEEDEEEQEIPLPGIRSDVLALVVEFMKQNHKDPMKEIEKPLKSTNIGDLVQEWYANFVNRDQEIIFGLVAAANYLDCQTLLDLMCGSISCRVMGKTPDEIRQEFNIKEEFTEAELAQVREENPWVS